MFIRKSYFLNIYSSNRTITGFLDSDFGGSGFFLGSFLGGCPPSFLAPTFGGLPAFFPP
jgi:hypothetical protein